MRKISSHSPTLTHAGTAGLLPGLGRYFRDNEASRWGKLFVLFAIFYIVFPLDAIPDFAPVIGWLDDLGVAGLLLAHLTKMAIRYRDPAAGLERAR